MCRSGSVTFWFCKVSFGMQIETTCKTSETMPVEALEAFQGKLKSIDAAAFEKLRQSIIQYGFSFPIFIWKNKILDGHQRLAAVKKLIEEGYEIGDLPVVRITAASEKEAAEKLLLINSRYAKIDQSGFDDFISNFEIDLSELNSLIDIPDIDISFDDDKKISEGLTDPDDIPEIDETAVSKTGDIWILGDHRIMCGDSTKEEDVEKLMNGEKADVCLTDPPYGIIETHNSKGAYDIFEDTIENVINLSKKWLPLARKISKVVIFSSGITRQWIYPEPNWVICWFYGGGQLRSPWGFNCWQPFLCYGKDPSLSLGNGCRPDGINLNVPSNSSDINHPCPKPIKLWEWFIERLSFDKKDLFFEPFSGSGTTIIAAEQTGRRCFAMELSPNYVDVAVKRWQELTGKDAMLESTGKTFEDMAKDRITN
jgi:DNA modification methylase